MSSNLASGLADLAQKVAILVVDLVLALLAVIAMVRDWQHSCDEMLHLYGIACIILCLADMGLELLRCSSEGMLDRLQANFQPAMTSVEQGDTGLLDSGSFADGPLGQVHASMADTWDISPVGTTGSITTGKLGRGVKQFTASQQKRVNSLHFWSIVFAGLVSVFFSFFSADDEQCVEYAPNLYSYIHTFTYVFILRLGIAISWICCRTVQDYEDAAQFTIAARQHSTDPQPLRL